MACRSISLELIKEATKEFAKKIGTGGFSNVFLGYDPKSGEKWAVKCALKCREDNKASFQVEVDAVSLFDHPNIVKLIGFYKGEEELILIYKFASKGTLKSKLRSEQTFWQLSFVERLEIAFGIAEAINYLHSGGPDPGKKIVIHFDVKADNIFLNEKMKALLGDFGSLTIVVVGEEEKAIRAFTDGYCDPDYAGDLLITPAADVYSFGVVLLELVTGKPAKLPANDGFLANWARQQLKPLELWRTDQAGGGVWVEGQAQTAIATLAESHLVQEGTPRYYTEALFLLGALCVSMDRKARPKIGKVAEILGELAKHYRSRAESASNLSDCFNIGSLLLVGNVSTPPQAVAGSTADSPSALQTTDMHVAVARPTTALCEFTSWELASATKGFDSDRVLGSWRLGTVYKGATRTHNDENGVGGQPWVAVKLLNLKNGFRVPKDKIQRWGGLHHSRLEELIGYGYTVDGTTVLVHELLPDDSVRSHLSGPASVPTWEERVRIALDAAKGLEHLHGQNIVHGALSACNILLDKNLRLKISDYISFKEDDTDPGDQPTEASDVYEFGAVLLELLTGCRPLDLADHILDLWASSSSWAPHELRSLLDSRLEEYSHDGALRLADLAKSCCQEDEELRPSMPDVVRDLAGVQAAAWSGL